MKRFNFGATRQTAILTFVLNLFLCGAVNAQQGFYTVTNTNDSGAGSLRDAVTRASADGGFDFIEFDSSFNVPRTITLTSGAIIADSPPPHPSSNIIITGKGANLLTISGNGASRVFIVNNGVSLAVRRVTITGGNGDGATSANGGGAVYVSSGTFNLGYSVMSGNNALNGCGGAISIGGGRLGILDSVISGNTAKAGSFGGGICSGVDTGISNTTISGNNVPGGTGGGIYTSADTLTLYTSTVSGNSALYGGGIAVAFGGASATLLNSTVSGNTATLSGGGGRTGGGIENYGTLNLVNSTVAFNRVDGSSPMNGGGIFNRVGTTNIRNTIVAGNTTGTAPAQPHDVRNEQGVFNSQGNNLIGTTFNATVTWQASDILNQDAQLAPLANNGGPTQTHALAQTSPAINAGNNCVLTANGCGDNNQAITTDQRGGFRPINNTVDIGSYEFGGLSPTAATATVSGRVLTASGQGIAKARVSMTDARGQTRIVTTGRRGAFQFTDVAVGETYIFGVGARKFTFAEPVVTRTVLEHLTDVNFVANALGQ